jgi:hypothetical protein
MAIIPGYDAVLELGTGIPDDIAVVGKTINFRKTYTSLNRSVFGSAAQTRAAGVYGATFTFNGLVDSTEYGVIEGHADGAAVAFSLEIGDGGDAGTWAGDCIITEITAEADVEGDWMVSITAESTGAVTHT